MPGVVAQESHLAKHECQECRVEELQPEVPHDEQKRQARGQ
jgi:hypothetical protein